MSQSWRLYFLYIRFVKNTEAVKTANAGLEISWNFQQHQRECHCQLLIKAGSPGTFTKTLRVLDDFIAKPVRINDQPGCHHYCVPSVLRSMSCDHASCQVNRPETENLSYFLSLKEAKKPVAFPADCSMLIIGSHVGFWPLSSSSFLNKWIYKDKATPIPAFSLWLAAMGTQRTQKSSPQ